MPKLPKDDQLGPITAREVAKRHGMTMGQAEEIGIAAGVDIYEHDFTYLTRSASERFLAELYRRRGVRLLKREARKK